MLQHARSHEYPERVRHNVGTVHGVREVAKHRIVFSHHHLPCLVHAPLTPRRRTGRRLPLRERLIERVPGAEGRLVVASALPTLTVCQLDNRAGHDDAEGAALGGLVCALRLFEGLNHLPLKVRCYLQ